MSPEKGSTRLGSSNADALRSQASQLPLFSEIYPLPLTTRRASNGAERTEETSGSLGQPTDLSAPLRAEQLLHLRSGIVHLPATRFGHLCALTAHLRLSFCRNGAGGKASSTPFRLLLHYETMYVKARSYQTYMGFAEYKLKDKKNVARGMRLVAR